MDCNHSLVVDEGQHVCQNCGTVFEQLIDEGAEWRNYEDSKGEDQCRTGFTTSELLPESSYGSIVSYKGISSSNVSMKAVQRLSSWSLSSNSERSWMGIFDTIQLCGNKVGLPKSILFDACALYKGLDEAQKVRGETRRALMGAALFVSCRNHQASRSHEEIAALFNVNIRSLCKGITRFVQTENTVLDTQIGIAERLCSTLHLNDKQRDAIMDLLYTISTKSEDEFENTPKTIVAGVVAHIMGLKTKTTVKPVADASGVSSLSIHKLVQKLNQ